MSTTLDMRENNALTLLLKGAFLSKYHSNKERLRAKGTGWDLKESRLAYLFMTPLLLCLIGFMIVPMFTGILLSFQNASGDPVGMENYSAVLENRGFGIMYSFLWPMWSAMCCFPLYLVF